MPERPAQRSPRNEPKHDIAKAIPGVRMPDENCILRLSPGRCFPTSPTNDLMVILHCRYLRGEHGPSPRSTPATGDKYGQTTVR